MEGKRWTWIWQTWRAPKQLASTQDTWAFFSFVAFLEAMGD